VASFLKGSILTTELTPEVSMLRLLRKDFVIDVSLHDSRD